ncbi:MAG: Ig-like domain-containing protein, partial [Actinomycetota bacterium]
PEAPAVQVKADETGGVTVLEASATGEVKKTEVAADGTKTETVVDASALNLNKVEVALPPALESKPLEALPKLEERNLSNPNYKADEAYVPPTTVPAPKENAAGPTTTARTETASTVQTRNAALPTTTVARAVTAAGATPTTIAAVVRPTLANFRIASKTFGDDAFTLDPPDSNSPGGFRYASSRAEVATVSATTGRVTIVGAGTTTITATQAAVRGFEAGTITATLTVAKAKPTIAETKDITKTFGDDPFAVKDPVSNSTGTITYASSNEDVIKQSRTTGRWVIGGAGRATITVSQAATDDFLSGTDTFIVTVRKGTPDIKAPTDIAKSFLDADFDLPRPTSDSKGAITYTSSDANIVSVTGTKASIKSAGTATITASQAGTDDWLAASVTFKVVVSTKAPTLTDFADVTKTFGDAAFTLTAPKSNSAGAITYASSDEKIVTVGEKDGKVTVIAAGSATITASQAASGGFAAGSISAKVTVGKADPVISDLLVADKEFGDADFTLKPTAKSAGKFTYSTDKTDVFKVDADTGVVKVVGVGTATLTAKLSSTANYEAGSVSASVTVKKGTPVLTWSLDAKTYGDAPFDLVPPPSSSAGKFTYSVST